MKLLSGIHSERDLGERSSGNEAQSGGREQLRFFGLLSHAGESDDVLTLKRTHDVDTRKTKNTALDPRGPAVSKLVNGEGK